MGISLFYILQQRDRGGGGAPCFFVPSSSVWVSDSVSVKRPRRHYSTEELHAAATVRGRSEHIIAKIPYERSYLSDCGWKYREKMMCLSCTFPKLSLWECGRAVSSLWQTHHSPLQLHNKGESMTTTSLPHCRCRLHRAKRCIRLLFWSFALGFSGFDLFPFYAAENWNDGRMTGVSPLLHILY